MGGGSSKKYTMQVSSGTKRVEWLLHPGSTDIDQLNHDEFILQSVIGQGKFGLVFYAQHRRSSKYIAIKFIPKKIIFDTKGAERTQQEMNILRKLDHPFLIHFFGGYQAPTAIALVFEYAVGGELYMRMKREVRFKENVARFYFCEIASALGYMHGLSIVYRDLKPENILIDSEGHIKLCDFGFATLIGSDMTLHDGCGTAMYVAPEIASGHMKRAHGLPVDWWGLGCILYEMLTGRAPFGDTDSMSKFEVFNNINGKEVSFPMSVGNEARVLIRGLLTKSPQQRLALRGVKASQWVAKVDWKDLDDRKIQPPWIPPDIQQPNKKNFVDWPGVELPTKVTQQENSYCLSLDVPSCGRAAGWLPRQRSSSMITPSSRRESERDKFRRRSTNKDILMPSYSETSFKGSPTHRARAASKANLVSDKPPASQNSTVEPKELVTNTMKRKKSQAEMSRRKSETFKRDRDIKVY
mmetsp:Transcript_20612/g.29586  ORF Transcript_20612/g.29586 Transcript_20612/m.29586 type:complete len:468 (-) Transcript_20612:128-1531(-)|eukprot:CAMPEP_0185036172 /NCGR_PEP_ID=MMETSP1103-20130426/28738_1 /TAXON_ID=36769 /ORGANISM="Paraphysomonas bandaiensis, Strain Caron Lab Isolate" /LENGTH=467 /DNA_ID=CAMNT_0027573601 /DNA_START=240 /DNA_END=1643 /DNA_ORIENTATION=-